MEQLGSRVLRTEYCHDDVLDRTREQYYHIYKPGDTSLSATGEKSACLDK